MMAKAKSMRDQAGAILRRHLALNESKHKMKGLVTSHGLPNPIHSVSTFNKYRSALTMAGEWAKEQYGITKLRQFTVEMANEYLYYRAENGLSNKQLAADRVSLEYLTGKNTLDRVRGCQPKNETRTYTRLQIDMVKSRMSPKNALLTEIVYSAGLRAGELYTLSRIGEVLPSEHRSKDWLPDRFSGRFGVRYIVTGQNGLRREVLLPYDLASELEKWRLDVPVRINDRGVYIDKYYDLSGGNAWSKAFSRASINALGWSAGGHGLRHKYAKERMRELQCLGYRYSMARKILSQELGHFREDVTETYLR